MGIVKNGAKAGACEAECLKSGLPTSEKGRGRGRDEKETQGGGGWGK